VHVTSLMAYEERHKYTKAQSFTKRVNYINTSYQHLLPTTLSYEVSRSLPHLANMSKHPPTKYHYYRLPHPANNHLPTTLSYKAPLITDYRILPSTPSYKAPPITDYPITDYHVLPTTSGYDVPPITDY